MFGPSSLQHVHELQRMHIILSDKLSETLNPLRAESFCIESNIGHVASIASGQTFALGTTRGPAQF